VKKRKASGMLWLEVVGLAGDGLTGSGVIFCDGFQKRILFSLVGSELEAGQKLGELMVVQVPPVLG